MSIVILFLVSGFSEGGYIYFIYFGLENIFYQYLIIRFVYNEFLRFCRDIIFLVVSYKGKLDRK